MENNKKQCLLKILDILIVVVAIAIIILYSIEYSKISKLKKSYSELEVKYEEVLEELESYEKNKTNESFNKLEVDNTTSNINLGNLDINSELVQNLYSKILKSNDIAYNFEGSFYKEEKTTLNNLTNEEKLIATIQNLPDKEYTDFSSLNPSLADQLGYIPGYDGSFAGVGNLKIYSQQEIIKQAESIFGKNVKIEITSLNGCAHDYDYIDGNLYSYDFEGGGLGDLSYGYGEIQYALEDKEFIYIFDKFIYGKYKETLEPEYYTSSNSTIHLEGEFENVDFENKENTNKTLKEYIKFLYDNLYTYKHIFKKDNETGEYYWVSTEKYVEN